MNRGMFTSNKDDWETPQDLFDELNKEFNFTCDAAATMWNTKCDRFIMTDALETIWDENEVYFCNPPYGRVIYKWVQKIFNSWMHGCTIVGLLPARTDTKWFHEFIYNKPGVEIRFIQGRLKFSKATNNAPFPSMVVIWKQDLQLDS